MSTQSLSSPIYSRLRIILVEPYHAGNIGAVARAMKTMGFDDLVLVNPHKPDFATHEEAIAFSSNALDILQQARTANTIDEALEGCNFTAALSARPRVYAPPLFTPRTLAERIHNDTSLKAAFILGSERFGLPNEIIEKCDVLVNIPANPDYSSLNLAQSVQVLAYECRIAAEGNSVPETGIGLIGTPATHDQLEGMFTHLEDALIALNFLDEENPKKLMSRLRRLYARAGLETKEVNILRGISKQILWKHERHWASKQTDEQ